MSSELDSYPLSDLEERYQISRSMVYVRMKALAIVPEKQGRKAYLSANQIYLMDKLHHHLEEGGVIADFPELPSSYHPLAEIKAMAEFKELEQGKENIQKAIFEREKEEFALDVGVRLEELIRFTSLQDLLEIFKPSAIDTKFKHLEMLEKAAQSRWHLSTPDLCELLGVNSIPSTDFSRYGFSFKRHGRNGKYGAWKVIKSGD